MTIAQVDYSNIRPNPFQPKTRWPIDPESVRELADDIRANSLIHKPVGRRTTNGTVEIAVGHRRVSAWVIAFPGEPVLMDIMDLSDRQMYDHMIAEGQHRLDWTALEKGERLADYMSRFNVSQTEAAKRFNLTQGAASNLIRLARDLPADLKPLVNSRALPERHARTLVSLARINKKTSVEIGKEIAGVEDSERDKRAGELVSNFLGHSARDLADIPWPLDWKPGATVALDAQPELVPACDGCAFVESALGSDYCTRPACYSAKTKLWTDHELLRISRKFAVAIARPDEKTFIVQVDWKNESAARDLLDSKSAERDRLRLVALDEKKHDRGSNYYLHHIIGSKECLLASTKKDFEIKCQETHKASGASKTPPADETPAQKAAREKREERERQARREEKAALRRARIDVLWLITHTAEIMAHGMVISGGILDYCYGRMQNQGFFNHQDWTEFVVFENELDDKIVNSTGDVREDFIRQAILVGQMRRDIANFKPETEFDIARDITIVSNTIGKVFRLSLPKGWHDIPIHKTSSNCHVCGRFTSLDHITGVDQAAGWKSENGLVTCSDDCRSRAPARPERNMKSKVSKRGK